MPISTLLPLLMTLHANPGLAQACDPKDLKTRLTEASPHTAATIYQEIVACDPALASRLAADAFHLILTGPEGEAAAVAAIQVGADVVVRDWVAGQISDERSRTIAHLGDACSGNPAVVRFFVSSHDALGESFWRERWHRGLTDCREPAIQSLLRNALHSETNDASRFGAIVEVFSRNIGRAAIPELKELATSTSNEEVQLHILSAFADAAGVGSKEGTDIEAAKEAVTAIVELAPRLSERGVEQARIAVESLGDDETANTLAGTRYATLRQPDGGFLWGGLAIETAACKNGKVQMGIHYGQVHESGHYWPDQITAAFDGSAKLTWNFTMATKCKGQSTIEVKTSPTPLANVEAYTAWCDEELKEIRKRTADKQVEVDEDPLTLP